MTFTAANFGVDTSNATQAQVDQLNLALSYLDNSPTAVAMTLLQDWIAVDGRHEKIRAGMRVSAEIKTGDRRVIEYLLSPVMQAVKEAGRER